MKLSHLFSNENNTANLTKSTSVQQTPAQIARMNHQIRSLAPGQTLTGEIVGRNGSEVQIKLSEDMVLNARVDQNLNLEIGKNMTFEVKTNGTSLTLSPLFTNVSTDVNVLKALDMAGLPVNDSTVAMTEQLMGAGMSVNRNFLLQVYREINSFPQGRISDVIDLHKLGMPVNEANMNQMESYCNLTHQLVGGMDTILNELPDVAESLLAKGDAAGATNLYQELFSMVTGENGAAVSGTQNLAGLALEMTELHPGSLDVQQDGSAFGTTTSDVMQGTVIITEESFDEDTQANSVDSQGQLQESVRNYTQGEVLDMAHNSSQITEGETNPSIVIPNAEEQMTGVATAGTDTINSMSAQARLSLVQDAMNLLDTLQLPAEQTEMLRTQLQQFATGETDVKMFFTAMHQIANHITTASEHQNLHKLFAKPEFKELLLSGLKEQWLLTPDEVAEPGKVSELYKKLDSQLKNLSQVLENVGQNESAAFKAVTNMSQNVDFLQQINQMYTYVQLPLKLQGQDVNGELYVYANRKNLAEKNGNVSALLHLDMEHLGPVDVHVFRQEI